MSNYINMAYHPETGRLERAEFLDDHFGPHRYGVRFPGGEVFEQDGRVRVPSAQQAFNEAETRIAEWLETNPMEQMDPPDGGDPTPAERCANLAATIRAGKHRETGE